MGAYLNELMAKFTSATLCYDDSFIANVQAGSCDTNRYTDGRSCGFIIPLEGRATFSLGDKTFELSEKCIAHAAPNMFLRIETEDVAFRYAVIHYMIEGTMQYARHETFSLNVEQPQQLQLIVQQLLHYEKIPGNLNRLKCKALFAQLVETIFVCAKMHTYLEGSNVVDYAATYLTENFNKPVTIQEMSEMLQCDRRRLTYLFEKQHGLSPIQFLTELRIKHAKELLRTTNIPVGEVGEAVGYADPFYFSRVFKKNAQCTPSMYREQLEV